MSLAGSGALWIATAVVVLSLALSALFAGADTALTAASRVRMRALENGGDAQAALVNRLLAVWERFAGAMLIGCTVAAVAATALTTGVLVARFGAAGVLYAIIAVSVLVLIFGQVLPRTLAIAGGDRASLLIARPVAFGVAVLGPIASAVETLVRWILLPFRRHAGEHRPVLAPNDEIRGQLDLLRRETGVVKDERDMLGGLLHLKDLTVADVMVHRTKMRAICADLPANEIVREVLASAYTRLPLWRDRPDNIIGVLHAKDLLRALDAVGGDPGKLNVEAIALDTWFVPDTTSLRAQLKAFLARKTHFALVVDEYGEVMGLVTLEDILEEIVGDIKDEHDLSVQGVRPKPDGSVIVDGSVPIRDLNRALDWSLPDDEATTIAGLVIHEARSIPGAGQVFNFHGFRFEVLRKSRNRITALKITRLQPRGGTQQRDERARAVAPDGRGAQL